MNYIYNITVKKESLNKIEKYSNLTFKWTTSITEKILYGKLKHIMY